MSLHPKIQLSRLRTIGWDLWDPIGIRGFGGDDWQTSAANEYDNHLLKSVSLLSRSHSIEEVSAYLDDVAANYMGLGPSTSEGREAARATAQAIADYLGSLPDAPEALKP